MGNTLLSKISMSLKHDWKNLYFSEDIPEYNLYEMIEFLSSISDECECAEKYIFSNDPIAGAISNEQKSALCTQALKCGHEQADKILCAFPDRQLTSFCSINNISIEKTLDGASLGEIRFAEYEHPNVIRINQDCINRVQTLYSEIGSIIDIEEDTIFNLLLAHELYHYIEDTNPELFTVSYRHRHGKATIFGPARIVSLSEIGASAFASDMAGLKSLTVAYDVLLAYCFDKRAAYKLYANILKRLG